MKKKFTLLLFTALLFHTGKCQEGELQFYQNGFYVKQYSEIAGLVNNTCKSVYEDSRGFLWITTFKGLSRFDGRQFINFGKKEGLPDLNITQVSEDSLGFIYVSTSRGIARYTGYDINTGSYFRMYPQIKGLDDPIEGMIAIDSSTIMFQQNNGAVWLLSQNKLRQLSPKSSGSGNDLFRKGFDFYYAVIKDSLRVFDAHFKNIRNIYHEDSGYAGQSFDNSEELHLYSKGEECRIRNSAIVAKKAVPDSIIWFASIDTTDRMFYFKAGEIYYYNNQISTKILDLEGLAIGCNGIKCTRNGSIWVTTNTSGLFRITPMPYNTNIMPEAGYYFYYNNNRRTVGTNNPLKNKAFPAETYSRLCKIATSILRDKNGIMWICTNDGIYKLAPGKRQEHYLFPGNKNNWNESANRITGALETPSGDIWFYGSCGAILYSNGNFKHYTSRNGLTGRRENVRHVVFDRDGTILLADFFGRLHQVAGDTLIPLVSQVWGSEITTDKIRTDANGFAWIEFNKKLYKIEKQPSNNYIITDSIIHSYLFSQPEVKSFAFDLQNNCWISYAGGIMQVYFANPDSHYSYLNSVTYTTDDGLGPVAAASYDLCPDQNGNMILIQNKMGSRKIFLFSLKNAVERKKMQIPQVNIPDILINHNVPDWSSMDYPIGPMGIPNSFKLNHDENNILFNYIGISLSNPGNITYQKKLKGYDKEWQTTVLTSANYTNLPPGYYTFMIKAANPNGNWGKAKEYHFTILPPWYKTWWATILWVLICISIILVFFFLRINSIRIDNLKESNHFKSSLIGLIGHDMMTPLRYIAKVSLQLRTYNEKLSKQTTMDSLGEINVTATQLHFFGESIIHWIKTQNTEYNPVMQTFSVNKTIIELVEFHHPLATEKGNCISHEMPADLYCCQDSTLLRIILHNLLLNANKFTSNGNVNISAIIENAWLIVKVRDTGKGMDEAKMNSLNNFQPIRSSPGTQMEKGWGMGYTVIMDLLKYCRGTLQVKSKLNEGTEVIIKLPIGKAPFLQNEQIDRFEDIRQTYN